jgi:hypothetical protein
MRFVIEYARTKNNARFQMQEVLGKHVCEPWMVFGWGRAGRMLSGSACEAWVLGLLLVVVVVVDKRYHGWLGTPGCMRALSCMMCVCMSELAYILEPELQVGFHSLRNLEPIEDIAVPNPFRLSDRVDKKVSK